MLSRAEMLASEAARAIARSGAGNAVKTWQRPPTHRLYLPIDPLDTIRDEDKVAWLMKVDADTRRIEGMAHEAATTTTANHHCRPSGVDHCLPAFTPRPSSVLTGLGSKLLLIKVLSLFQVQKTVGYLHLKK